MKLTILQGDVFEKIKELQDNSIDLCITSPPYWGLRSYGAGEAELGCEPTMEKYLDNTLRWVKEVYRLLKPSGSFVLNIGDCFIGGGRGGFASSTTCMAKVNESVPSPPNWSALKAQGTADWKVKSSPNSITVGNLGGIYKTKQLLSVSSFAYCRIVSETDFVCRGEHIWAKPAVPSPIRSRLKHSHEKLFWFVKDADEYYFNEKPWLKQVKSKSIERNMKNFLTDATHADNIGVSKTSCLRAGNKTHIAKDEQTIEHSWRIIQSGQKQNGFEIEGQKPPSQHVAPYPAQLIEPYIKSLCPQDGIILDPFLGSGTTMRVAMENGRNCFGIELNPEYIAYAKKRLNWGMGFNIEYLENQQEGI